MFQIQHFLYTNNYRKYVCKACTKVADHLKNVIPTPPPAHPSKEVKQKETIISEKQLEVDTLAQTNRILQAEIKELSAAIARAEKNYRKEKEEHTALQAKAKTMKTGIKMY